MANYNFRQDLSVARKTEERVAGVISNKYDAVLMEHSNHGEYDLLFKIKNTNVTFEVKEDFMCEKTGNVSLEYECRGKPSGIAISKADYYIYVIHTKSGETEYVMFRTQDLKDMVSGRLHFRDVVGGDRGSNTKNYLFKYDLFISRGTTIHTEN